MTNVIQFAPYLENKRAMENFEKADLEHSIILENVKASRDDNFAGIKFNFMHHAEDDTLFEESDDE